MLNEQIMECVVKQGLSTVEALILKPLFDCICARVKPAQRVKSVPPSLKTHDESQRERERRGEMWEEISIFSKELNKNYYREVLCMWWWKN